VTLGITLDSLLKDDKGADPKFVDRRRGPGFLARLGPRARMGAAR